MVRFVWLSIGCVNRLGALGLLCNRGVMLTGTGSVGKPLVVVTTLAVRLSSSWILRVSKTVKVFLDLRFASSASISVMECCLVQLCGLVIG